MTDPYGNDSVVNMLRDLDNKEMHGIDCGRGNFSANPKHHDNYRISNSRSNINTNVNGPGSDEENLAGFGLLFCATWIGLAIQSWWAFGGVIVFYLAVSFYINVFQKEENRDAASKKMGYSIFALSLIGIVYFSWVIDGLEGLKWSVGGILGLAGLAGIIYFFSETGLGNKIMKAISYTIKTLFYSATFCLAIYGCYLLYLES